MNNRIEYVDNLKGIAILFMVMGHVMQMSLNISSTPFNLFYTSFHMPIFMFLSGLFVYKKFREWNSKELFVFFTSKVKRMLFPFVIFGGFYSIFYLGDIIPLFTGQFNGYWFLPALFMCMVFDVLLSYLFHMIKVEKKIIFDLVLRGTFWFFCMLVYTKWNNGYFRGFLYHYPFFVFGTFFVRYKLVNHAMCNRNLLYSLAIVFYIIFWVFRSYIPLGFNMLGFPSIVILIWLSTRQSFRIPRVFSILGINSLEIYVIHRFFVPSLLSISSLIDQYQFFDKSQNFVIYLLLSMFISFPICYLSILISKILKNSNIIKYICFGIK